MLAKEVWFEH